MRQTVVLPVPMLAATLAQAGELRKRKSGLWEVKRSQGDANPLQLCVEEKSEPVHGKTETSAVIEQRWTGPCKPDQKPAATQ